MISIPDYPWFENNQLAKADAQLADHATAYVTKAAKDASSERFLFGYLPVVVFEDLLNPGASPDLKQALWMMHLSGYFGGRWLRGEIAKAQPEAMLVGFSITPSREGFMAPLARIETLTSAIAAADAALLEVARSSLFDTPSAVEGGEPVRGLGDTFGYNAGYMLEILASPPQGIAVPEKYMVYCNRLMNCDYNSPKLAATMRLRPVADQLASADGDYAQLRTALQPIQDEGIVRGKGVWSTGLSVQGFDQVAYDQLLDVSSSFLETVEATVLTVVKAVVDRDANLARVGMRANAAMIVWLASYMCGLLNGEGTIEIPQLAN